MSRPFRRTFYALPYLCAILLGSLGASPSPTPTVDWVITRMLDRAPRLASYSAHVTLDIRQLNFPYLHPVVEGTQYYTSPGLVVSDFPHMPFYLRVANLERTSAADPRLFRRCYDITMHEYGAGYALHLVPKPSIRNRVTSLDLLVDGHDWTIRRMDWRYVAPRDHITLDMAYSDIGGFTVMTAETGSIRISHVRAQAVSTIDRFQFNVPVPTPTPKPEGHECDSLG